MARKLFLVATVYRKHFKGASQATTALETYVATLAVATNITSKTSAVNFLKRCFFCDSNDEQLTFLFLFIYSFHLILKQQDNIQNINHFTT